MVYVEILKGHPGYEYAADPDTKFLKDDLIRIAEENGILFPPKTLVADMKDMLITEGVLTKKPGVREYVIDFEERQDALLFFTEIYKGVVMMITLSEMFGVYLPNMFERFGGLESAQDFKEFEAKPKPKIKKVKAVEEKVAPIVPEEIPEVAEEQIDDTPEELDTF